MSDEKSVRDTAEDQSGGVEWADGVVRPVGEMPGRASASALPRARIHTLKCWPFPFHDMKSGAKRFEYRKNDRDFRVGDCLVLQEYEPTKGVFTWECLSVRVTYVLPGGTFGVPPGDCVLSIEPWERISASALPATFRYPGPDMERVASNPSTDADRANRFYEEEWDTCQPTRTIAALVKLIAESRSGSGGNRDESEASVTDKVDEADRSLAYSERSAEWRAGYDEAEAVYHARQAEMRRELRVLRAGSAQPAAKYQGFTACPDGTDPDEPADRVFVCSHESRADAAEAALANERERCGCTWEGMDLPGPEVDDERAVATLNPCLLHQVWADRRATSNASHQCSVPSCGAPCDPPTCAKHRTGSDLPLCRPCAAPSSRVDPGESADLETVGTVYRNGVRDGRREAIASSSAVPSDMGRAVSWLQKWVYSGDDGPNLNTLLAALLADVRRETIEACAANCDAEETEWSEGGSSDAGLDRDDYNAELSRRAQSFGYEHRDCNPNGATVMNAIFRLLADVRRETIEACANVASIPVLRDEPHRIVRNIRNLATMSAETIAKLAEKKP